MSTSNPNQSMYFREYVSQSEIRAVVDREFTRSRYGSGFLFSRSAELLADSRVAEYATTRYLEIWKEQGPLWDVKDNGAVVVKDGDLRKAVQNACILHQRYGGYSNELRYATEITIRDLLTETGDNTRYRCVSIGRVGSLRHRHTITIDNRTAVAFHARVIDGPGPDELRYARAARHPNRFPY